MKKKNGRSSGRVLQLLQRNRNYEYLGDELGKSCDGLSDGGQENINNCSKDNENNDDEEEEDNIVVELSI